MSLRIPNVYNVVYSLDFSLSELRITIVPKVSGKTNKKLNKNKDFLTKPGGVTQKKINVLEIYT